MLMTKRIGGYRRIKEGIKDCCRAFSTPRNFNRAKYAATNPDTKVIITLQKSYTLSIELTIDRRLANLKSFINMGMMFIGSFSARILQASLETLNKDLSYLRYASTISLTALLSRN